MNERNTAGRLGFIKDSEGVYRKGNFVFKDGKIMRESAIVPEGTIKDLQDNFITIDECIRSILAYPILIGDTNPRATNVYVDKVGNNYKPSTKLSKNTVAVVMSNRQVMDIKPRDIPEQDDTKELAPEEKPDKPKAIKDFSKPAEFDKIKKESAGKKVKLKEATGGVDASYHDDLERGIVAEIRYVIDEELQDADNVDKHEKLEALTEDDLFEIAQKVLWDEEFTREMNETISHYIYHYDKML